MATARFRKRDFEHLRCTHFDRVENAGIAKSELDRNSNFSREVDARRSEHCTDLVAD